MKKSKYFLPISLALGLTFLIVLGLISNILLIGERLGRIFDPLEWIFYGATTIVLFIFLIRPILQIVCAPSFSVAQIFDDTLKKDWNFYRKIASNMIKSGMLSKEEASSLQYAIKDKQDLRAHLKELFDHRIREDMEHSMIETAQKVFVITGISQSGRFDSLTMLTMNFRMLKSMVMRCGFRPSLSGLLKLYVNIAATALVTDAIEDLELDELIPSLSDNGFAKIPGLIPIFQSTTQAFSNALLTLRIALIAREYMYCKETEWNKSRVRKTATKEAFHLMKSVMKGLKQMVPGILADTKF